jgi:hypothetical protein
MTELPQDVATQSPAAGTIGPVTIAGLLDANLLDVDGNAFSGRDLLAAGIVAGLWQPVENGLVEGLGLIAANPVSTADAAAELRAFRLRRSLYSAEDMRAWLAPRALSVAAATAAAARVVARGRGGTPASVDPGAVAAALPAEAICSGALIDIGWWLADRLLSAHATDTDLAPRPLESRRVQRCVWEEARTIAGRAIAEPAVRRAERIARLVVLDEAHRDWEASLTGDTELSRRLREHELDWCRYEIDELRPHDAGAAAEVARQLVDGVEAEKLAAAARIALTVREVVLADAPASLVRALTGAVAGDVAGPWTDDDGFVVVRVRARHSPSGGDTELAARGRTELIAEGAQRLRAGRVRWHERC